MTTLESAKAFLAKVTSARQARKERLNSRDVDVAFFEKAIEELRLELDGLAEQRNGLKKARLAALAILDERALLDIDATSQAMAISREVGQTMREQLIFTLREVKSLAKMAAARQIVEEERATIAKLAPDLIEADKDVMLAHMGKFAALFDKAATLLRSVSEIRLARQALVDAGFEANAITDEECKLPEAAERAIMSMATVAGGIQSLLIQPLPNMTPREKPKYLQLGRA